MTTPVGSAPNGKGRPTPKRSEAQKRRTGPVAPPPSTRKEAARRAREQAALARAQVREGTMRGDEKHMVKRDQGPVRALVRDTVDGRRNVGVLLLPLALLLVVARISGVEPLQAVVLLLWLSVLLAMMVDVVVTTLLIRRRIGEQHPEEKSLVGHVGYGLLRSTVLRRFRLPPPRVAPGALLKR